MTLNRQRAAAIERETLEILKAWRYRSPASRDVEIGDLLRRAADGTCSYLPDSLVPETQPQERPTQVEVENETTLAAAQQLVEAGYRPAALNFASAKNPGGGFLSGARAQEESLARSSGLYACLEGNSMYEFHRAQHDPMYANYAIYSPDVPVFRADDGSLLNTPYLCSFITAPAVNAKVVLERDGSRRPEIRRAMQARVAKVLAIAARHGHEALVLGAWGCGVFGNDPDEVAGLFQEALAGPFRGAFSRVRFAVLDSSASRPIIGPFLRRFGQTGGTGQPRAEAERRIPGLRSPDGSITCEDR